MYKRPLPRPKPDYTLPLSTTVPWYLKPLETETPKTKPLVEKKPMAKKEIPVPSDPKHVAELYSGLSHRPPIQALVEAMTLDGYPPEKISQARKKYAWIRNTEEERQAALERAFAKFNVKTAAPPKKILKVVKKKT